MWGQESVYRERGLPWEPRLQSGLPSVLGWVMEGQALPSQRRAWVKPEEQTLAQLSAYLEQEQRSR